MGQTNWKTTFLQSPDNISFETQGDTEHIILFLRQHWATNVLWIAAAVLGLVLPLILSAILPSLVPTFFDAIQHYQWAIILVWYLVVFGFVVENFLHWYFNVYFVTDERIIDVDFVGLLYKSISEARLSRVQDVTSKMVGVIRATFNYGDVFIQTAGEKPEFDFMAVPKPDLVAKILNQQINNEELEWEEKPGHE